MFGNSTSRYRQPRPRLTKDTWSLQLETEPVALELTSAMGKPFCVSPKPWRTVEREIRAPRHHLGRNQSLVPHTHQPLFALQTPRMAPFHTIPIPALFPPRGAVFIQAKVNLQSLRTA